MNATERQLNRLLKTAPVNLDATFQKIPRADVQEIERLADSLAARAALVSEYLGQRYGFACGDHGHERALEQAHKRVKKVRKALGYTVP